jgi:hypothetical protein
MTNLAVVSNTTIITLDEEIERARQMKLQLATLKKEYEDAWDLLKTGYFATHTEYRNSNGIILATYIGHKESRFQSAAFEEDHPDIYALYKKESIVKRFEIK